ncbi:MAG: hypothetical protein QM638_06395, partial [Nocardioides sp.]|uniref:hypothetical protein n=1 Tax=Nocardioides sp. TaxID=35761 RepID=UPI0039E59471
LPLVGDGPAPGFGAAPVDPAELPAGELVRGASLLLAEDLVTAGPGAVPRPGRRHRLRHRYRLAGDRWLVGPLLDELVVRGRPEGGRGLVVYVVAPPLERLLADVWVSRAFGEGVVGWPAWLRQAGRRHDLPPRADLRGVAGWWRARVGESRVQIVTELDRLPELLGPGVLARLVGPGGVRGPRLGRGPRLSADAAELARQVGPVLGVLVDPGSKETLLRRTLLPRLVRLDPAGPPLGVPEWARGWIATQARRQRDALREAGYAVHGDLAQLSDRLDGRPPRAERVLELALAALHEGPAGDGPAGVGSVGQGGRG